MMRRKLPERQLLQRRDRPLITQQALGGQNHQRLAPLANHLPPQSMKILSRRRGIENLNIVTDSQSQKPLQPGAANVPALALPANAAAA